MESGKEEVKQGQEGAGEELEAGAGGSGGPREERVEEWQRLLMGADRAGEKLARHRAHCAICRHEQREDIERDYLDWVRPSRLVETYKLANERALYRHVHAVGLYWRRRYNREAALDRVIQGMDDVSFSGRDVLMAIRMGLEQERKLDAFLTKVAGEEMRKILVPVAEEVAELRRMNRGLPERDEPGLGEDEARGREKSGRLWWPLPRFSKFRRVRGRGDG